MNVLRKQNLALFAITIVNLAAIFGCMMVHAPARCAGLSFAALVATTVLAFVSFESREAKYRMALVAAYETPLPEEVVKRIRRFGLTGEHPRLIRASWMYEIAADRTQDGYWEWVTKNEVMIERLLRLEKLKPQ